MTSTLHQLFMKQYRLCKLTADETVAVISEQGQKQNYVNAAVSAAQEIGAGVIILTAPSLSHPMLPPHEPDDRGIAALLAGAAECDMVVDVTVGGLIHSTVRTRITGNGKRMLFVAEPANVLDRLMGNDELRQSVLAGGQLLKAGTTLRVTSPVGTDLSADIAGESLPITHQWGYVDEPGRWDHWPSGFVACFPNDRTAEGTIVLQPGDALIPWQRYVRDEVVFTVEDGFIVEVKGGADAFLLRDYFESWNDPEVWAISHMGWGLHPIASWAAFDVYDAQTLYGQELRSASGNFMWSTGSNRFANRDTPAHLDVPMRDCTVQIDGHTVVDTGRLVPS
jgi:2,5-dihydroxypyridine 5,6-dioxygenase